MTKQKRKTYKGEKNDKERTMGKLLTSVGKVLEEKGYTGLTVSNIAKKAGVDRKLISTYFGSLDSLVETYIKGKDYWISATKDAAEYFEKVPLQGSKSFMESALLNHMDSFLDNTEMQKIILWQISQPTNIMAQISREREKMSTLFFNFADKELKDSKVDLRAISSILVAAIYYIILHSKNTDSTICEIDLKSKEGMDRIRAAVKQILNWAYDESRI